MKHKIEYKKLFENGPEDLVWVDYKSKYPLIRRMDTEYIPFGKDLVIREKKEWQMNLSLLPNIKYWNHKGCSGLIISWFKWNVYFNISKKYNEKYK